MTLDRLFEQYGRTVRVASSDDSWQGAQFRAFIQPLRYKNKMYLEDKRVTLGIGDMSYYLYLGPAVHDLSALDNEEYVVKAGEDRYSVTRAEKLYYSDSAVYIWAVLRRIREEEEEE